jgi:hypothetical protein
MFMQNFSSFDFLFSFALFTLSKSESTRQWNAEHGDRDNGNSGTGTVPVPLVHT